ncbi:MAG TPA: molybdopterin-binding protein [Actinomycetota bacterium]
MPDDGAPRAAVLTVSDGVANGSRVDESGDVASRLLEDAGFAVAAREVVPDERDRIEESLRRLAASHALVVTTGGTGFGPRDVTPEATRAVVDREAPGLAELMRSVGLAQTPMAALSRATSGAVGSALVVNLPGSPRGVSESLAAVLPVVPHAVELLGGATGAHPTGHAHDRATTPQASPTDVVAAEDEPDRVDVKAVKIVEGTPPCRVGMAMSIAPGGEVRGTLGCAEFDAAAVEAAGEVLASGAPETRVFHHELGDVEVYLEPHRALARIVIVSATDVARALRRHVDGLGYRTVLVESRRERVAAGDGPSVDAIESLELRPDDVAVLTDHDAPDVVPALTALLRSPVRFVGVMGSRRHVGHYVETLRAAGFDDGALARIRSPLGLDLGGRTAEEIALSIAAGVVADAHGREGGWLDR